ncbi:MAG: sn-glycerol-1-phosphate dehydrogenase [Clostridia bacterium]|nr:sn-glycerol-1-phosphate dehydrogenase [Clostridia bacterium]
MIDVGAINRALENCPCGRPHRIDFRALEISRGNTADSGRILRDASFPKRLHAVYDGNTVRAAAGVLDAIAEAGFIISHTSYENLTVAAAEEAQRVKSDLLANGAEGIVSIGTGSLNDICRLTAAELGIPFAIIATAPSMDGFASVMAPITVNGFKRTLPAKCPEVIIADTEVLAASPDELKAAGLGDLLGKYTALADWEIARITTGEYYCESIASLTRDAVDRAVSIARYGNSSDPEYGSAIMDALVLSGLAMLLSGCTRPASGAEHHLSHFWEMKYLMQGKEPLYHGKKVGIATGMVADVYAELAKLNSVRERRRVLDEAELAGVFGPMWKEARAENFPNPLEKVPDGAVEKNWQAIRAAYASVPSGDDIRALLRAAGGEATCAEAGISPELEAEGLKYGKYARFRITGMRLTDMMNI